MLAADGSEYTVHVTTRIIRAEAFGEFDRLVQDDSQRNVCTIENLENTHAQDQPVDRRHPLDRPALGVGGDDGIDVELAGFDAPDDLGHLFLRGDHEPSKHVGDRRPFDLCLIEQGQRSLTSLRTGIESGAGPPSSRHEGCSSDAGDVLAGASVDFDAVSDVDEQGNLDRLSRLQFRRLSRARNPISLHSRLGTGHRQLD